MTYIIVLAVIVVLVACVLHFADVASSAQGNLVPDKPAYRYQRKEFFMTRAENYFYKRLLDAVGDEYFIFPQVSVMSLVDEKITGQNWKGARAHMNRKSVDYVLCDKGQISPRLAIELDDASHERRDRQERDQAVARVLEQGGVPLLRVHYSENVQVPELKARIQAALQK